VTDIFWIHFALQGVLSDYTDSNPGYSSLKPSKTSIIFQKPTNVLRHFLNEDEATELLKVTTDNATFYRQPHQ
jgi:hypothetical protein